MDHMYIRLDSMHFWASALISPVGLDKLCFFLPIILFDYSQKVSLLFQFGVPIINFILKRKIDLWLYCSITTCRK